MECQAGLRILSSRDGSVVRTLRPLPYPQRVVVAPDDNHAVLLGDRRAELVSLADGATIARSRLAGSVAAFRHDGREVAISDTTANDVGPLWRVVRLRLPGGQEVGSFEVERPFDQLVCAPSGDALAVLYTWGVDIVRLAEPSVGRRDEGEEP